MHTNVTTSGADAVRRLRRSELPLKRHLFPYFADGGNGKWEGRIPTLEATEEENRCGEEGLVVGRAAWDSAGSRMPFARGGQDIGQAIKSADGAAIFVMGTALGARGAWQSREQSTET